MSAMISPVSKDHIPELISSFDGSTVEEDETAALQRFIEASVAVYTGMYENKLLGIFGLIPPTLLSDQAYLWLQVTPSAAEHQFVLVRQSQIEVKKMLEIYPRIVGHCEADSPQSMRWLGWLGAKFGEPVEGLVPFTIRRKEA